VRHVVSFIKFKCILYTLTITCVNMNCWDINEQMQSDIELAEAALVAVKSQTETCNSELHEVENQVSSQRAELRMLQLKFVDIPQSDKVLQWLQCVLFHYYIFVLSSICILAVASGR